MHTPVLFEHPLNEKMRTWLRIEFLIQQMAFRPQNASSVSSSHGQKCRASIRSALTSCATS